jgi:hypothetical protein
VLGALGLVGWLELQAGSPPIRGGEGASREPRKAWKGKERKGKEGNNKYNTTWYIE